MRGRVEVRQIVEPSPQSSDLLGFFAYGVGRIEAILQPIRSRDMIRMRVCIEHPRDGQTLGLDLGGQSLRSFEREPRRT